MFELLKANWEPYYGNNTLKIEVPDVLAGGSVSFLSHLGKPLSQALWEDLIHRFVINGLCVYRWNDLWWTVGWGEGHCCINLDKNEKVSDIHFSPYQWHRLKAGKDC